jgi:hypothetical protein
VTENTDGALSDRDAKTLDFAQELVKQLLTLATGIVTVTLTFFDQVLDEAARTGWPATLLKVSWCVLALSICAGLLALMALTGGLAARTPLDINSPQQRRFARVQASSFALGIGLAITAVLVAR